MASIMPINPNTGEPYGASVLINPDTNTPYDAANPLPVTGGGGGGTTSSVALNDGTTTTQKATVDTNGNLHTQDTNSTAIANGVGTTSDAAWTLTGSASEIAILKKLALLLNGGIALNAGSNLIGASNIADGTTPSHLATVSQFHNADNQSPGSSAYGLLTGGVAQLLNSGGNLDRQRSAYADALATTGIEGAGEMLWNGSTFDRAREAYSDGLAATGIGADAAMLWNGSTFDRLTGLNGAASIQDWIRTLILQGKVFSTTTGKLTSPASGTLGMSLFMPGTANKNLLIISAFALSASSTQNVQINTQSSDPALGTTPTIVNMRGGGSSSSASVSYNNTGVTAAGTEFRHGTISGNTGVEFFPLPFVYFVPSGTAGGVTLYYTVSSSVSYGMNLMWAEF